MPMNPRLLRPIVSGVHPEAAAWRTAVVANGGSVSASTMRAVSKFCADIDKASIRDRFYRLNLFAGTGLNACLVPLYRGQSRTGTQYGGTVDQSLGSPSFDEANYTETGASGGLLGSSSTSRYLNTGVKPEDIVDPPLTGHLAVYDGGAVVTGTEIPLGTYTLTTALQRFSIERRTSPGGGRGGGWGGPFSYAFEDVNPATSAMIHVDRSSPTGLIAYINGVSAATFSSNTTVAVNGNAMTVFGVNRGDSVTNFYSGRLRGYSIGFSLSSPEAAAYYTAMLTFQTALDRA